MRALVRARSRAPEASSANSCLDISIVELPDGGWGVHERARRLSRLDRAKITSGSAPRRLERANIASGSAFRRSNELLERSKDDLGSILVDLSSILVFRRFFDAFVLELAYSLEEEATSGKPVKTIGIPKVFTCFPHVRASVLHAKFD